MRRSKPTELQAHGAQIKRVQTFSLILPNLIHQSKKKELKSIIKTLRSLCVPERQVFCLIFINYF